MQVVNCPKFVAEFYFKVWQSNLVTKKFRTMMLCSICEQKKIYITRTHMLSFLETKNIRKTPLFKKKWRQTYEQPTWTVTNRWLGNHIFECYWITCLLKPTWIISNGALTLSSPCVVHCCRLWEGKNKTYVM